MSIECLDSPYGLIPSNFKCSKLEDLCISESGILTGPFGSQLHQEDYVSIGTPIVTVEHLGENRILHQDLPMVSDADLKRLDRYILQEGDIVFSRVGSVDRRALIRKEEAGWLFSGRCLRVRPNKDLIDPVYLSWFFGLPIFREYIRQIAVGATMPSLNTKLLSGIPIHYPALPQQRAIARILGTLDDKIELNRRMNETQEAMARAIFKSWFVDFDPVRAKAEGQEPTGMDAETAALFPDSFEETELGIMPKGWKVGFLPNLIDVNPSRSLRREEIAPYLNMSNMPTHGHAPENIVDRPFGSGMRFINGDTLVARITPCLENGKTAFVDFLEEGQVGWGSTEYIVLRPKQSLPEEFAYCLARSNEFREFAIQSMTGSSGRQRVPAESLAHFQMPVAPQPIIVAFGRIVKPLFARSSDNVRQSRTIAALRDALLPRLISGEMRLKVAERCIIPALEISNKGG